MTDLSLVIGNRNYSSWSLRAWITVQHLGLPCREIRIALDQPTTAAEIARHSAAGRVPVLIDGDLTVWESIAILEYLNELKGGAAWPAAPAARAVARAVAAEMHAGFMPLRNDYPMNIRGRDRRVPVTAELGRSIARIDAVWSECRRRFGAGGPWLFGSWCAADAMYLPVAFRFRTYGMDGLGEVARTYAATATGDPLVQPYIRAAEAEPETIGHEEVGL